MRWLKFTAAGQTSWGIIDGDRVVTVSGDPFGEWQRTRQFYALKDVKIEVPLVPRTFYCVGLNYLRHLKEAADKRGEVPNVPDRPEIGYRAQPHATVSWSVSAFYNDHDDLRSIEATPVTFFPLYWGNNIEGATYGVEIWGNWQATSWWRLSPGFRSLHKRLEFKEGALSIVDLHQAGNDPTSQASLKSSMNFGRFSADAVLRYVGKLPSPANDDYTELTARFAFQASEKLELSLSGFNLLDDTHQEYVAPTGNGIRRSVHAEIRRIF